MQPWRSFFLVYSWQVWTVGALGIYGTAVTMFAFRSYYHHPENIHYCTGLALVSLFGVPVPYYPTHGMSRIHFGLLLIYGLLAVIYINCYLTSLMTRPPYQYQIDTTDDLMYYKYKILSDLDSISLYDLGNDEVSG